MKVLELFAGIGACSKALERIGIDIDIVDAVEIDKYAIKSFNAIHGTNFEVQDIKTWDKDIKCDLIMHGSPCQDFSVAGKQAGGDIGSGTRSSLMYETIRIVGKLRPKYVIWENVKNLLSKKHKHNFDTYIDTMKALGYTSYYQVLNAKDYGVPQNRERVFTVSILNGTEFEFPKITPNDNLVLNPLKNKTQYGWHFEQSVYDTDGIARALKAGGGSGNIPKIIETFGFPPKQELKIRLKDVLDDKVDEKYYLGNIKTIQLKISPTLTTMGGGNTQPKVELETTKIRKLTPKECWRLMGFDDEDFEKASKVNSNSQLYKQAGNSIVVNVLEAIFTKLLKE